MPLGEKELCRAQKDKSPGNTQATDNLFNLKIHPGTAADKERTAKTLLKHHDTQQDRHKEYPDHDSLHVYSRKETLVRYTL
ncbi:hypothetical protein JCM39068_12000 [Desulfocastanea catecholica]